MADRRPQPVGTRDRPVTIQQLSESIGPSRFPIEDWTTLVELEWMGKRDSGQSETFRAEQLSAPLVTEWEMGYRPDMDPELIDVAKIRRLLYEGRVYDITGAVQMGRKDGIALTTIAKAG